VELLLLLRHSREGGNPENLAGPFIASGIENGNLNLLKKITLSGAIFGLISLGSRLRGNDDQFIGFYASSSYREMK